MEVSSAVLYRLHFFPGLCLYILGVALIGQIYWLVRKRFPRTVLIFALASLALLSVGYLAEFARVYRRFPVWWVSWLQGAAIIETVFLVGFYPAALAARATPVFQSKRRTFLKTASAALCIAPVAMAGFGILERNRFRLTTIKIPVANLPKELDGLRIVQITDIHLSPFLSEREFARAVDMANETHAHLALVTGDLISRPGDPLDACLKQLSRLRADAGVLGCLGNHEAYTHTEDYVTAQGRRIGIEFLRGEAKVVRFGGGAINFAGVDYQRASQPYLEGTGRLIVPGTTNILLSHNPDVFPVAAGQGYDLTIAGHTHGGQVDVEILHQHWNAARYFTPYVRGLYKQGSSSVYVSTGLGTIGAPIRLGAPPEVNLLQLCAT